jgi:hypothetical protein
MGNNTCVLRNSCMLNLLIHIGPFPEAAQIGAVTSGYRQIWEVDFWGGYLPQATQNKRLFACRAHSSMFFVVNERKIE